MTSSSTSVDASLAIEGGPAYRTTPWPARHLFGEAEKAAAMALFDESIRTGQAFGYNGRHEEAYCLAFTQFMGGGVADAVNSGTNALYVALRALNLEPFTEIIVPPITDAGGVMPVPLINCIPVPADCEPDSLNTSAKYIAQRITPRTRAIVVAHIAGHPCDMDPILELAAKHNLLVIEDCAQAHGATYKGRLVGTMGDIAAFSTMSGKHHATAAQGGVVYSKHKKYENAIRQAADRGKPFGLPAGSTNVTATLNFNSNELACAVGVVQLKKLPTFIQKRQAFARDLFEKARALKAVRFIDVPADCQSVYWFLVARVDVSKLKVDKATFAKALAAEGFPVGESYWHCPVDCDWYRHRSVFGTSGYPWAHAPKTSPIFTLDDIPNARKTLDTLFPLHISEACGQQEVQDIIGAIAKLESVWLR